MKPGALQHTLGALWVRCGCLTHPESRREQQHPQGCVAAFIPIGQRTLFNARWSAATCSIVGASVLRGGWKVHVTVHPV